MLLRLRLFIRKLLAAYRAAYIEANLRDRDYDDKLRK